MHLDAHFLTRMLIPAALNNHHPHHRYVESCTALVTKECLLPKSEKDFYFDDMLHVCRNELTQGIVGASFSPFIFFALVPISHASSKSAVFAITRFLHRARARHTYSTRFPGEHMCIW